MLNYLKTKFNSSSETKFEESEHGNYYAKLSCIPAHTKGDASPKLRKILKKLGITEIMEIEGEGGMWWDFDYKGSKFTCDLLVKSCGGSELYPASCTKSTDEERGLLRDLVSDIMKHI